MRNVLVFGSLKKIGTGFRPFGSKFGKGKINSLLYTIVLSALGLAGCKVEPEPILFGKDHCEYCKMTISEVKFGAELVTTKGRVYKFDAVECMVPYMMENPSEYSYTLAIPYDNPGELSSTESLTFVISEDISSPMGANLAAFKNEESIEELFPEGERYSWTEVKSYFAP